MPAPGLFVWFDVMTHSKDQTIAFYTALFDWAVEAWDTGGGHVYPMFKPAGAEAAEGGVDEIPEAQRERVPSHWINYVTVPDVDGACQRVAALGGKVLQHAYDIPKVGRTAVCADPQGALFAPFTPNEHAEESEPTLWGPCWVELMTSDREGAIAFYTEIFGYGVGDGPVDDYTTLMRGTLPAAGVMASPMPEVPPHWLTYIWVDDLDARVAQVGELGGRVVAGPMAVPTVGRVAVCLDDQGAAFGLFGDPAPRT